MTVDPPSPARRAPARPATRGGRLGWLPALVLAEWRHHPWRQAAAVLAVTLGVALAYAVQLINGSALGEFEQAVRAAGGTPDAALRGPAAQFDEAAWPLVARRPEVASASPVVEVPTAWRDGSGRSTSIEVLGLDALVAGVMSPDWIPVPDASGAAGHDTRFEVLDPDVVFANAAARAALRGAREVTLRTPAGWRTFRVAGRIAAGGPPLLVMDIAGAQDAFGRDGRLSRIDVRLVPGVTPAQFGRALVSAAAASGPRGGDDPGIATLRTLRPAAPDAPAERMQRLTRSYRVNLGVLALVALFTGGFLVFSVQSLAVARRVPQLALLGVLGLAARDRRALVLADGWAVGLLGSGLGLALGAGLAAAALRALGGDLGSGLLGGGRPPVLHIDALSTLVDGGLGLASALAGAAWPARAAAQLAPAQALKGLSVGSARPWPAWAAAALAAAGLGLAALPPWGELPWAAYAGVALLLLGGIGLVPATVSVALGRWRRAESPVLHLALARAVDQRATATAAVAGVVASLSLVVALTVMISSFRDSLSDWLRDVLPADLYVRPAPGAGIDAFLSPAVVAAAARLPEVARSRVQRQESLSLSPEDPAIVLLARDDPGTADGRPVLPWVVAPDAVSSSPRVAPRSAGAGPPVIDVYPSEVLAALRHLRVGDRIVLPMAPPAGTVVGRVQGIWRDYARQQGALVLSRADWLALTHDERVTDLALWLRPGAEAATRRRVLDALQAAAPPEAPVDAWTTAQLRSVSLDIFDRSFAVTRWLQGVALAIGLAGIAASFSAQVLARRREFGTLQHLGFTRAQVLSLVTAEGALWTTVGVALGVALGLVVSGVLVEVVNPRSFHWTMRWSVPWGRLAELAAAAIAAGAVTAGLAGRAAAGRDMARAVREDW